MTIDYHKKYLKYKRKYLEAKKIYGGISKIEGGGFGLGQGNQGQDKGSWEGGWRFRPKGNLPPSKEPNPSTRIEIELWEYLWAQGLLPDEVVKAINNFLASSEGRNPSRHWVPEELNRMLYRDTIEAFPSILESATNDQAIIIMKLLTRILDSRIEEYETQFKESRSWKGHINVIKNYIKIYEECTIIMNDNKLFNGDERRLKSGRARRTIEVIPMHADAETIHADAELMQGDEGDDGGWCVMQTKDVKNEARCYDVTLYRGEWTDERSASALKKNIDIRKEVDKAKNKSHLGSVSEKYHKTNKVFAKRKEDLFKTKISKSEAKKFKEYEEEDKQAVKKKQFMKWVDEDNLNREDNTNYSSYEKKMLFDMWDEGLFRSINYRKGEEGMMKGRAQMRNLLQEKIEEKIEEAEFKQARKENKKIRRAAEKAAEKAAERDQGILEDSVSDDDYKLKNAASPQLSASQQPPWKGLALNEADQSGDWGLGFDGIPSPPSSPPSSPTYSESKKKSPDRKKKKSPDRKKKK